MGEMVEFFGDAEKADGYFATPAEGAGPGLLVIQEWWGLVPQLKGVCDELAQEGFSALAPDLYHGEVAEHDEMDKAGHLMSSLPSDRAAKDMSAAVDFLLAHPEVRGDAIGVVGFCMGGMLSWIIAALEGAKVSALVPYYGYPSGDSEPDWSGLAASVMGHMAENDDFFPPSGALALAEKLQAMGKDVTIHVYPGTGHAFANETNALGTYDPEAARQAWVRTLEHLRKHLG
jgi:carboxymethylenebutenolidase